MDRDLVERARSGDQAAFADLVHQVSDSLYGIARRILRDPGLAEDVLQDALVTIWRKLPHLREPDHFEAWAYRILVNACYAEAPRNRRWTSTVRLLPIDRASDADELDPSLIATSWSRPSAGCRSTNAPSSSFITTRACPSWRWPRRSVSRTARRALDSITQQRALRAAFVASRERDRLREGRPA